MQSTPPSSEYDAPDEYPLDEESMVMVMHEAGWQLTRDAAGDYFLRTPEDKAIRVPSDEQGRTVLNAFKIFLWHVRTPNNWTAQ